MNDDLQKNILRCCDVDVVVVVVLVVAVSGVCVNKIEDVIAPASRTAATRTRTFVFRVKNFFCFSTSVVQCDV